MTPEPTRVDGAFIDYFGGRLMVPKGHFDETRMLEGGIPEPHVMQTFQAFVRMGHTCLDIGANIGTHTFVLASIVGRDGRVFAVEADIDNAGCLRRSIVESRAANITLLPIAAADRPGMIRLLVSEGTNSVFSAQAAASEVKAAGTLPLDLVIRQRVDFIKLDIEGAELLAVRGMENIIAYSRPIILTEFAPSYIQGALGADLSREFVGFFLDRGYQCRVVDPYGKLHHRGTVDEVLDSHAASKRDYGWNHVELLFTPAEIGFERLYGAASAQTPAAPRSPAAVPTPDAAIHSEGGAAFVPPPFLAEPPSLPGVAWHYGMPSLRQPVSQLCTSEQMEEPAYRTLCAALGLNNSSRHRKVWEFAYILAVLRANGMAAAGRRGLGFGTGREPLPSALAAAKAHVLATDAPSDVGQSAQWSCSNEWAGSLADLWHEALVPRADFEERVQFRPIDMNAIPVDLRGFDFCWSACCLEHLGSIRHGLNFIRNSLDTLRPGGIAVHTTEFNVMSNGDTMDTPTLCLFRKRDVESLAAGLVEAGHHVEPLNFWPGANPVDLHIDLPPYSLPHLKLELLGHVTTSIGVVVRKAEAK